MTETVPIIEKLYRELGGATGIAKIFDIAPAAVSQWGRNGIPVRRIPILAQRSGIPAHEIAPDIFPRANGANE